jgi:signal transduction histidine kinase
MSADQLLQYVTQGTLILILLKSLVEYSRNRDRIHLDILLMFGDLALIVLIQLINTLTSFQPGWFGKVTSILLVVNPYLLLRLVQNLRPISPIFHSVAFAGMVVSCLLILLIPGPLPVAATILIVVYFVAVEIYAAVILINGSRTTRGVSHWRLLLAAAGSMLIAALIFLAGAMAVFPAAQDYLAPVSQLVGLAAVLGYYLGFAPPNWLRRSWQFAELHRFLKESSGKWSAARPDEMLQRLCVGAERAVGGQSAFVALREEEGNRLLIRAASHAQSGPEVNLFENAAVKRVWRTGRPALWRAPAVTEPGWVDFAGRAGMAGLYLVPILIKTEPQGILLVSLPNLSLFEADDLELLALLCDQTAIALGYIDLVAEQQTLIEQLSRYNERLEVVHAIDRAILSARSPRESAAAALSRLHDLVPSERIGIILFDSEANQAQFVAVSDPKGIGPQEGTITPLDYFPSLDHLSGNREVLQIGQDGASDLTSPIIEELQARGIRSILLAPLIVEERLMGVMLISSLEAEAFQQEHQEIAREVADQMAISIRQARLLEGLRRSAAELEQRVIERTAQLEAANQELEAFAYSVSHDLRAPLRAIDGFSRIMLTSHSSGLPDEARRYLQLVRENTTQMGELIDDLLTFSRLSRQPLNKQSVNPAGIVRLSWKELLETIEGRQLEITIQDLPACEADPGLLKQVFVNLLSNAIKFTRGREPGCIEVGTVVKDGLAAYFVKDNGVGFDMRYAHKLFGVFQRLHRADEFEGTGVGLAIIQRIIARHGGQVWAEAEVDRGATFYFTLP